MRTPFLVSSFALIGIARAQSGWAVNEDLCDYTNAFQLVFQDDFHGSSLNSNAWVTYSPFSSDGSDQCVPCRADGGGIKLDSQIHIGEGLLTINSLREQSTWMGVTRNWKIGHVQTRQAFNEGRFEIRCEIPGESGSWPAFWIWGGDHNEIDVFEFCGLNPQTMRTNIHRHRTRNFHYDDGSIYVNTYEVDQQDPQAISVSNAGYHTYAVEWLDEWIIWYFDGVEVRRSCRWWDSDSDDCTLDGPYTGALFPTEGVPLNVIVSTSRGDGSFCEFSDRPNGYSFDWNIDYVRIWQNEGHFESGLTNLCAEPTRIVSSIDHFCNTEDEIVFTLEGPHGDPISWGFVQGSGGLYIVESDNEHCRVRLSAQWQSGDEANLRAYDPENPCHGSYSVTKHLYIGTPWIEPITGNGNTSTFCPWNEEWNQYWCIEPVIAGARRIYPTQCYPYTTYYPPDPVYNPYPPGSGPPNSVDCPTDYGHPYLVYVDGVEQTVVFRAHHTVEEAPGASHGGDDCQYAPFHCNEHWCTWGNVPEPFCMLKEGDFCHDIRIVAQNGCGTTEAEFVVADKCVPGPCDFLDPDPTELGSLVSVYPAPASTDFTISINELIALEQLDEIRITDALQNEKTLITNPGRDNLVQSANWPPGVYYITVKLESGLQTLKFQVK